MKPLGEEESTFLRQRKKAEREATVAFKSREALPVDLFALLPALKRRAEDVQSVDQYAAYMVKSAGAVYLNLNPFEFVKVVREEPKDSIDPHTGDERERILEGFRKKRPHYSLLVCFQFWTGARPSEAFALRWGKVDLKRGVARIDRSLSAGFESYTKTRKSRRDVRLHSIVIEALRVAMPLHVADDDFVFRTEQGKPLDIRNFFQREWQPMLRRLGIRPRPFYNTRHTYISYAISLGMKLATVCAQTGTSPAMIEKHYGRYMPQAGDFDVIEAVLGGGERQT